MREVFARTRNKRLLQIVDEFVPFCSILSLIITVLMLERADPIGLERIDGNLPAPAFAHFFCDPGSRTPAACVVRVLIINPGRPTRAEIGCRRYAWTP